MTLKVGITNILKSEETNHAGYLRKRPCFMGNRSNSDHNRFIYLFIYLLKRDVEKKYILDLHLAYVNLTFITRCCLKKCGKGIP